MVSTVTCDDGSLNGHALYSTKYALGGDLRQARRKASIATPFRTTWMKASRRLHLHHRRTMDAPPRHVAWFAHFCENVAISLMPLRGNG